MDVHFAIVLLLLFSLSVVSNSLQPHESQHARPPCPSPTPGVHWDSCPSSQWYHPAISSSVIPFSSCLQSFPASGSFPVSRLFASGGQSVGASALASVLPKNVQNWFPPGLTSLISLQSKSLLQHHSSKASILQCSGPLYGPNLTSMHDYWKNHSFHYMGLCWQSNVPAF